MYDPNILCASMCELYDHICLKSFTEVPEKLHLGLWTQFIKNSVKNNFSSCFSIGRELWFCAPVFNMSYPERTFTCALNEQVKNRRAKPKCASDRETFGKIVFCSLLPK